MHMGDYSYIIQVCAEINLQVRTSPIIHKREKRIMKKLLAMTVLFEVLSVSAATAQAAGRAETCCDKPNIVAHYIDDCTYYNQYVHQVVRTTWTECLHCGHNGEPTKELVGYEEHDYNTYDLENHVRYCDCGDSMRF